MSEKIDASTASQLALASMTGLESSVYDIMIQENIRRQHEIINNVMLQNIAAITLTSASELFFQQEAKRQYEMMKSMNPSSPWIDSLTYAKIIPFEPKIDEEITIKKSQWNSLQEELANKEQRIAYLEKQMSELSKTTIPQLDRKVNDSMKEFHTDMEKNMPEVRHVSGYLRSMESKLGDPDDNLE